MKATALLEKQHRKVESLFSALEDGKANARQVEELATALTAHAMIEEEIFYPEVKRINTDLVLESYEEHELMAYALKRLVACEPEHESFHARVKACKELVTEHVQEEETELFPAVTQGLGEEKEEELGRQMEARFKEIQEIGYEGATTARKAKRNESRAAARASSASKSASTKKKASHAPSRHA